MVMKNVARGMSLSCMPCLLVLIVAGCAWLGLGGEEKLSPEEYAQLVELARGTIINAKIPAEKLSNTDRAFVKINAPYFDVKYTGYKKGRYSLTWIFDDKRSVRIAGEGDMRDYKKSFQMLVLNTDAASGMQQ